MLVYLTSFTVFFSGDIEEKKKKKSSETDQSAGHFQSFFIYFFSFPDPRSEQKFPKIN